jgi:hypothetical protein
MTIILKRGQKVIKAVSLLCNGKRVIISNHTLNFEMVTGNMLINLPLFYGSFKLPKYQMYFGHTQPGQRTFDTSVIAS